MTKVKPFDLQAALQGEPVMLRGGEKVYVRHHETEIDAPKSYKLIGYHACGEHLAWGEDGSYCTGGHESHNDIIGMWPKTRIINGFEVPVPQAKEPEAKESELGVEYYLANTGHEDFYVKCNRWVGAIWEMRCLERGLVFLNKEDAIATAKAMIGINPYEESEE
jgi:hypothetical protein